MLGKGNNMIGRWFTKGIFFGVSLLMGVISQQTRVEAATYNLSDYYLLPGLTEKVSLLIEEDDWGAEDSIIWKRYGGSEQITAPATGTSVTAGRLVNSFGETRYYVDDGNGRTFYRFAMDSPEDGQFIRQRYNFNTVPGNPQSPSAADFNASNLTDPSPALPATLDTANPYTATFASVKYDPAGGNPGGYRVEQITVTVDDNSGSLWDLSDPSNSFYEPEFAMAWEGDPSLLQGLLQVTLTSDMYFANGAAFRLERIDYRKPNIGLVSRMEIYTDINTSMQDESNVCYLMKYSVTAPHPAASGQTPILDSQQIQVVDGTGPVDESYAFGIVYDRDEFGWIIYNMWGEPEEDYWTGSVVEDSPGSGLFTIYFFNEGTPDLVDIMYAGSGYAAQIAPGQDLVAEAVSSAPALPTYVLSEEAIQVTFHVKDSSGNPIADVEVEVEQDNGMMEGGAFAITDSNGDVTLNISETITDYMVEVWTEDGSLYLGGPWQGGGVNDETYATVNIANIWPGFMTGFTDGDVVQLVLGQGITISGTVTDGSSGVADVRVSAEPEWDETTGTMTGSWSETTTDSSGNYQLVVSAGNYKINFQTNYWDWQSDEQITVPGGYIGGFSDGSGGVVNDWMLANVFNVQSDVTVDAALVQGVSITGVVVDSATMTPITTPMNVNVHSSDHSQWYWADVANDGSGAFTVTVEPGGTYAVELWPGWDPVTGNEDSTYSGGSFIVHPDPYNNGTLNPLFEAGYDIENMATTPNIVAGNVTQTEIDAYHTLIDPSGNMTTALAAAGLQDHIGGMVMGVWDEHIVTSLTVNQTIKILPQVEAGAEVKGRLVDGSGNGISHAWINAMVGGTDTDENGCFSLNMPTSSILQGSVSTFQVDVWPGWDPTTGMQDNSFIGGVVNDDGSGNYTLTPMWDQATQFAIDLTDWPSAVLPVECGDSATGLIIQADAGVTISGTVTDGTDPIANVWVNAWSHDSNFGNGSMTDSFGAYSIPVQGSPGGTEYEVGIWEPNFIAPEPQFVTVTDTNGTTDVDFVLSTGNAIKGRVVDADGNALRWMWVDVYNPTTYNWFGASTDDNGNYRVSVDDGTYIVKIEGWDSTGNKSYQTKYYNNAASESSATPVIVSGSDVEGINFRMTNGNSISGTITGIAQGDRVWVDVWSENANAWGGVEVIGSGSGSDNFTITGLNQASDFRLSVWSEGYISGQYGGILGGDASSPGDWNNATLLDTTTGNVTGVNIALSSGATLTLTVTGVADGDEINADVWSDTLWVGGWGFATATGDTATVVINGINPSATDYRLWVSDWQGKYKSGFYKGDLTDVNPGTLTNWSQATFIDMSSGDESLLVSMDTGGSISGTITGIPEGARVWIDAWSENTGFGNGVEVIGVSGGAEVSYQIKGLELVNDYRVGLWGEEVAGGFFDGVADEAGGTTLVSWDRAGRISIAPPNNENFTGANIGLQAGRTISGTITGLESGEWAWLDAWSNETYSWSGKEVSADGSGTETYSLKGLLPNTTSEGGYEVGFFSEGYVHQRQNSVDVSVGDATGVDFTAATGGSISGTITGLDPQEWVWIDAWSPVSNSWGGVNVTANADGIAEYTIEGLADASDYVVSMSANAGWFVYSSAGAQSNWDNHEPVTVSGSEDVTGIDFDISAIENYSLAGTVEGLSGSEIVDIYAWSDSGWGWTNLNGNGDYLITGLPDGNYTVEVWAPGYMTQRTAAAITVTSGTVDNPTWTTSWSDTGTVEILQDTVGLDVTMSQGFSISGTVTDGSNPVSYIWVNAWSQTESVGNGAATDANGAYTIEGLPNGTYKVEVWTPDGSAVVEVTVDGDDVTGADLVVSKESGSVSGTITQSAAAVDGALVFVYDNASGDFIAAAATDALGQYLIDDLAVDVTYRVDVYLPENDLSAADATDTVALSSGGGEEATLDFTL